MTVLVPSIDVWCGIVDCESTQSQKKANAKKDLRFFMPGKRFEGFAHAMKKRTLKVCRTAEEDACEVLRLCTVCSQIWDVRRAPIPRPVEEVRFFLGSKELSS